MVIWIWVHQQIMVNVRSVHYIIVRFARKVLKINTQWMYITGLIQVISSANVFLWMNWNNGNFFFSSLLWTQRWETVCMLIMWKEFPSESSFSQTLSNTFGTKEYTYNKRWFKTSSTISINTFDTSECTTNRSNKRYKYYTINVYFFFSVAALILIVDEP